MICGCKFSISTRCHHCRSCGDIICSSCSRFKRVVPEFNLLGSVKVCNFCNTENTVYRKSKLLGTWGNLIWQTPTVGSIFKNSALVNSTDSSDTGGGLGDGTTSSCPPKIMTFRETKLLITILDAGAGRNSIGYDNEDDTHNQVTMMVDDVQFSSEIASNDAINAKDFQPYTPVPTTTTTTTTTTIAAVNVDGSPDDPQAPTAATNTITTTADNTTTTTSIVTKVDGSVGQNCRESIHDEEYCESVDLSQTFDGTLNSPGVPTTSHSVEYEEDKDFNSSESEKCSPIGDLTTSIHTHSSNLRHVQNSIYTDNNPHILRI